MSKRCVEGMRQRRFMTGIANYHIYKAEICFLYGAYAEALEHVRAQDRLIASGDVVAAARALLHHRLIFVSGGMPTRHGPR